MKRILSISFGCLSNRGLLLIYFLMSQITSDGSALSPFMVEFFMNDPNEEKLKPLPFEVKKKKNMTLYLVYERINGTILLNISIEIAIHNSLYENNSSIFLRHMLNS